MGAVQTLARAASPAAIRQALRGPTAPAPKATRSARIGSSGPSVSTVMPALDKHSSLVRFEALTPDPQRWFNIMSRADRGDTSAMIDLFYDARDRDSHLEGVARKRTQSMMGRPIVFRPPEGLEQDDEALDNARFMRRVLLNETRFVSAEGVALGFRSGLQHLMSATTDSYAVSPLGWRTNERGETIPHLEWAHSNRFGFDSETRRIGFYAGGRPGGWTVKALSEYPDRFVAHIPMNGRSDYPWRRGAMRSCIVPSFIKREGLRFWLVLTERFGMPQPFAQVPPGLDHDGQASDDTVATVKAALANLGRTWNAVFSSDVKIDSIPGSGNVKADVHKALIDWAETTESIAMLGQNLSTKVEGGSFAAAEAHRYVAGDIHLADATELAETVTQQLCEPIIRYNRPGTPVPVCQISTGQRQPFTAEDVLSGLCTPDEYRREKGHEAQPLGQGAELRTTYSIPSGTPGPKPVVDPMAPPDDLPLDVDIPEAAE